MGDKNGGTTLGSLDVSFSTQVNTELNLAVDIPEVVP